MGKRVDSQALGIVDRTLGLAGKGSPVTELEDGQLVQTFDTVPAIRRGRTVADSSGMFSASIQNVHVGASDVSETLDLYNLTSGIDATPPFPGPVPRGFDLWVVNSTMLKSANDAAEVIALMQLPFTRSINIIGAQNHALAFYQDHVFVNGQRYMFQAASTGTWAQNQPRRIPRGALLRLDSTAAASLTVSWVILIGMFPEAIGQDAVT